MVQVYVFGRASSQYFSLPLVAIFDFESKWSGLGRAEIALDGAIDQYVSQQGGQEVKCLVHTTTPAYYSVRVHHPPGKRFHCRL